MWRHFCRADSGGQAHHWPAFNVADSAICIGIALLFVDMKKSEAVNAQPA